MREGSDQTTRDTPEQGKSAFGPDPLKASPRRTGYSWEGIIAILVLGLFALVLGRLGLGILMVLFLAGLAVVLLLYSWIIPPPAGSRRHTMGHDDTLEEENRSPAQENASLVITSDVHSPQTLADNPTENPILERDKDGNVIRLGTDGELLYEQVVDKPDDSDGPVKTPSGTEHAETSHT